MSIDLAKYVMTPGQGEVIPLGPPNSGQIIILVDPKNTGETRFCMLIQEYEKTFSWSMAYLPCIR